MTDYLLQAKIKNGRIMRRLREMGYANVNALCSQHGLYPSEIGRYMNFKKSPRNAKGEWRPQALKLAYALACEPDDLFTDEQQWIEVEQNQVERFLTSEDVSRLTGERALDPSLLIECEEMHSLLGQSISGLKEREQRVVGMRFGTDGNKEHTLEEIGNQLGVTRTRAREILGEALRKIRGKKQLARSLYDFVSEDY